MKKIYFKLICSMSVTVLSVSAQKSLPQKPNIFFYLSDDQNIEDYSLYGSTKYQTPAVDRLAKEGMTFNKAFTGQAICAPSRSQLYTGLYPLKNGVYLNHVQAKTGLLSVAQLMRTQGYEVILAGKSHVKPASVFDWDKSFITEETVAGRESIPIDSIKNYLKTATKPFCMFIASHFPHGNMSLVTPDNELFNEILDRIDGDKKLDNSLIIYASDHGLDGKWTVYDRGLNVPFVARWKGVIKPGSSTDAMVHFTDVLPTFLEVAGATTPNYMDGNSFIRVLTGESQKHQKYVYGVRNHQNLLSPFIFPSRMVRSESFAYIKNFNSIEVYKDNLGNNEVMNYFIERGAKEFADTPFEELFDIIKDPTQKNNLAGQVAYKDIQKELSSELDRWMRAQKDYLLTHKMPLFSAPVASIDKQAPVEWQGRLDGIPLLGKDKPLDFELDMTPKNSITHSRPKSRWTSPQMQVEVFPHKIVVNDAAGEIRLINMRGEIIQSTAASNAQSIFDVPQLRPGMYLIRSKHHQKLIVWNP